MIFGDLRKFKDRCLTNAAEILIRLEGDGPFAADDWNLLEAELRMHKALVMELHFMSPLKTSSKANDAITQGDLSKAHFDGADLVDLDEQPADKSYIERTYGKIGGAS